MYSHNHSLKSSHHRTNTTLPSQRPISFSTSLAQQLSHCPSSFFRLFSGACKVDLIVSAVTQTHTPAATPFDLIRLDTITHKLLIDQSSLQSILRRYSDLLLLLGGPLRSQRSSMTRQAAVKNVAFEAAAATKECLDGGSSKRTTDAATKKII